MIDIATSLMKVDISQVAPAVLEGLRNGVMRLSDMNGVVYWAANSGKTGVVAHLPMVSVNPSELASAEQVLLAIKSAQGTALAATAVSTLVVVVAVAASVAYLGKKIAGVVTALDRVESIVDAQDRREYLRDSTRYLGSLKEAREFLESAGDQRGLAESALMRATKLAEHRSQALLFLEHLPGQIADPAKTKSPQYANALRFMTEMFDAIPSGIWLERELYLFAGQHKPAQMRRGPVRADFKKSLAHFKIWCDGQFRAVAEGEQGHADVLRLQRPSLRALFHSKVNDILLDGLDAVLARDPRVSEYAVAENAQAQVEPPSPLAEKRGSP